MNSALPLARLKVEFFLRFEIHSSGAGQAGPATLSSRVIL